MPKLINNCVSYAPGHQVHWIQAKVKRTEPKYDATVVILSETKLMVSYQDQTQFFSHHACDQIQAALEKVVLGYIKYSPTAQLLYVQTQEPNDLHHGAFSLSYLSEGELSDCLAPDPRTISISDIELED